MPIVVVGRVEPSGDEQNKVNIWVRCSMRTRTLRRRVA
jgi:hypothetical protein